MSVPGSREPFWCKCHSEVHGDRAALPCPSPAMGTILPLSTGLSCSLLAPFLNPSAALFLLQCEAALSQWAEKKEATGYQENQYFYRVIRDLFWSLHYHQVSISWCGEWGDCLRNQSTFWWAGAGVVGLGKSTANLGLAEPTGDLGPPEHTHLYKLTHIHMLLPLELCTLCQLLALLSSLQPGLGASAKSKKLLGWVPGINYMPLGDRSSLKHLTPFLLSITQAIEGKADHFYWLSQVLKKH